MPKVHISFDVMEPPTPPIPNYLRPASEMTKLEYAAIAICAGNVDYNASDGAFFAKKILDECERWKNLSEAEQNPKV